VVKQPLNYEENVVKQPLNYEENVVKQPLNYEENVVNQPLNYEENVVKQPINYEENVVEIIWLVRTIVLFIINNIYHSANYLNLETPLHSQMEVRVITKLPNSEDH
jgi:hypothetical protein